jgi:hypothetical protein
VPATICIAISQQYRAREKFCFTIHTSSLTGMFYFYLRFSLPVYYVLPNRFDSINYGEANTQWKRELLKDTNIGKMHTLSTPKEQK